MILIHFVRYFIFKMIFKFNYWFILITMTETGAVIPKAS